MHAHRFAHLRIFMHCTCLCSRPRLQLSGTTPSALLGLLELLYPPATFRPHGGFDHEPLTLKNLAGVARLASALHAPAPLRHCGAARDRLGVVPQVQAPFEL